MKQFINAKESLVVDSLDGLLRSSGGANLARLDGYPGIKVVLRTDHKPSRVAIVAGGEGNGEQHRHDAAVAACDRGFAFVEGLPAYERAQRGGKRGVVAGQQCNRAAGSG